MHEDDLEGPAVTQLGEAALWGDLVRGEAQALGALFDRYSRQVYNSAFRRTAPWVLAEEITQATFVSLWRRARTLPRDLDNGRGWLFDRGERVPQRGSRRRPS